MMDTPDIIVIGAGAAGLAAAAELGRAGLAVIILEARNRIGGRMFTERDPVSGILIEYGAEFIHGLPPEIWQLLQSRKVGVTEFTGDPWCFQQGRLAQCNFFSEVDDILKEMNLRCPDMSFLSFLNRRFPEAGQESKRREARKRALAYVSGFNAADPGVVGVHWLVKEMEAEEQIEGDRAFRSMNGYADLVETFSEELSQTGAGVLTETVVNLIAWKKGHVEISYHRGTDRKKLSASRVLITLPLGVLKAASGQTGSVQFTPGLPEPKLVAMRKLEMGKVIRVTLRFRQRFWDSISPSGSLKTLSEMGFLFSDNEEDYFPTWWTTLPVREPVITGWSPFRSGERLSGKSRSFVIDQALQSLSRLLHLKTGDLAKLLESAHFHDWQNDPFSRGAYSYGAIGANEAQVSLASPVEHTLFFAGEATDVTGHTGTVHGAIASGQRAAREVMASLR